MPTAKQERMQILARFLRSQIALVDRPPVGRVELNNEEAEVCAVALDEAAKPPHEREPPHCPSCDCGASHE